MFKFFKSKAQRKAESEAAEERLDAICAALKRREQELRQLIEQKEEDLAALETILVVLDKHVTEHHAVTAGLRQEYHLNLGSHQKKATNILAKITLRNEEIRGDYEEWILVTNYRNDLKLLLGLLRENHKMMVGENEL